MSGKVVHSFHGVLEPIQTAELPTLSSLAIELIEVSILAGILFFIFFAFKNFYLVNSSRSFPRPEAEAAGQELPEKERPIIPTTRLSGK